MKRRLFVEGRAAPGLITPEPRDSACGQRASRPPAQRRRRPTALEGVIASGLILQGRSAGRLRGSQTMKIYDYIVVGAGSAGAAVANRLSSDPRNKVLLLEAGRASHPWSPIPIGMARLIANPAANWLYSSEPEANTNGRRIPVPRGKLLGGSSSINGMVFVRGQAQDFDTWAQMGNRGWSYAEVLPFFKHMESYAGGGDDSFRGREGPLRVTNPEPRDPLFATLIKAAAQVGSGTTRITTAPVRKVSR
jgi:choline dehydrogenase-like flavoprotein